MYFSSLFIFLGVVLYQTPNISWPLLFCSYMHLRKNNAMDKPTNHPQTAEPPGIEIPFHRQQEAQDEPTSHGTRTTRSEG